MTVVTNKLKTHLTITEGLGKKGPLQLSPKGKAAVDRVTGPILDAQKQGLVVVKEGKEGKEDGQKAKGANPKAATAPSKPSVSGQNN